MNLAHEVLEAGLFPATANQSAFLSAERSVTHAQFRGEALAIASQLEGVGLKKGDTALLRMTNSLEFAAVFVACIWRGVIPVLVNSQFGRAELEHIGNLSKPTVIFYLRDTPDIDATQAAMPWSAGVVVDGRELRLLSGKEHAIAATAELVNADADEPAFIVFTSGTTGKPKGVVHAHRWLSALGDSNRARVPPKEGDVVLATGEWSFISALGHNVLFPLRNGTAGSIMADRASPERILETIARDGVTLLHSVATLYRRILGSPGIEKRFDLRSLRGVNSTGEPLESSVRLEWKERVNCPVWEHYGVSEAQMILGDGPNTPQKERSVGKSWGAKPIIIDADRHSLPAGEVGRLVFDASYPGFFLKYLGDPKQTEATLSDGLFLTNDLARIDEDGYVYILGRADDCFKSKGVLIVPSEVESAILGTGAFEEACVFPIPDDEVGNLIGAALILRNGSSDVIGTQPALSKALDGKIARFKVPNVVATLLELPKNSNGKTQRTEVAKIVRAKMSARGR